MSAFNLRVEDYFYCEVCCAYKDRPEEPMIAMSYPTNDDESDDPVEMHFCKMCLQHMLEMLEKPE